MTTTEREITSPVDLCADDGTLNPDARGWSRRPLHRANLSHYEGRNKRWDYWAILAGDLVVSSVISDIDVFGLAEVFWVDLVSGNSGGRSIIADRSAGIILPESPGTEPLRVRHEQLQLSITDDVDGTQLNATWTEDDGRPGSLTVRVGLTSNHESLNVVIPWDDETFNYTSKHQARPATGELVVGECRTEIGGASADAWGVLDVGRGRWPHDVVWNWGGGAGRSDEHVVGLQFGAKWTTGSGFTENGVIVDGRLSKIGRELEWTYDWDDPMEPWRVTDPGGQLDVTLVPRFDKVTDVEASADLSSHVHQVFGFWSGWLVDDDGRRFVFSGVQGFAEEARQRW